MSEIKIQLPSFQSFAAKHNLNTKLALIAFFNGCIDALSNKPRKANQSTHYNDGYDFEKQEQGGTHVS